MKQYESSIQNNNNNNNHKKKKKSIKVKWEVTEEEKEGVGYFNFFISSFRFFLRFTKIGS